MMSCTKWFLNYKARQLKNLNVIQNYQVLITNKISVIVLTSQCCCRNPWTFRADVWCNISLCNEKPYRCWMLNFYLRKVLMKISNTYWIIWIYSPWRVKLSITIPNVKNVLHLWKLKKIVWALKCDPLQLSLRKKIIWCFK